MTLLHPYTGNETKAKEPIDQELMDLKVRENLEDLSAQVDAISGGGSGGAVDSGAIGEILVGLDSNEARYWKRRFHPLEHMLNADSSNPSGFDPEGGSLKNELLTFIQSNDTGFGLITEGNAYLGQTLQIFKDSKQAFKTKKGVNFFSIGVAEYTTTSDSVTILIDGQSPSSLGLTDENGDAAPDTFSTSSAALFYQSTFFFYGLDGEEHLIEIINTDSASKYISLQFVEVGYRSDNPAIGNVIDVKAGKANVRGAELNIDGASLVVPGSTKNGRTDALIVNDTASMSILEGESPAMTQVRAEEDITFSSTVTTLPVKSNFYFPDNGIVLLSTPYGGHFLASYTSKTDTLVQANSLDGIIWQSKPTEDFTTLSNFTGSPGEATGDLNINYWATAPMLVDSSNNKVDFEVTIAGVTSSHTATIDSGRYAADLVPFEAALDKAMQAVKPITGRYRASYNSESQLWTLWTDSAEVERIDFLFNTGLNALDSVKTLLGFLDADLTSTTSYVATTEVQHIACRVLEKDSVYMHTEDPRIKYSQGQQLSGATEKKDVEERLNLGSTRFIDGELLFQVFPDNDCTGLRLDFIQNSDSGYATVQVDDGQMIYLTETYLPYASGAGVRGKIISGLVSFPRGSKKITVRVESLTVFNPSANKRMIFAGCQQYFTKPSYEKLTNNQAVLKTFDIAPLSLYGTIYGHNGGNLYSPTLTDNINTVVESGVWTGDLSTDYFNQGRRYSNTIGDYVEVDFTLVGDGGGFAFKTTLYTSGVAKVGMFLSQSTINEATDRLQTNVNFWGTAYYDQDALQVLGLKAGTYKIRVKVEQALYFINQGFVVYDTVPPEENKNTVNDVSGIGQSITYPINVRRESIYTDSQDRVPAWLQRAGYKEGRVSKVNYSLSSQFGVNHDDSAGIINEANGYYSDLGEDVVGASWQVSNFCKSISLLQAGWGTYESNSQAFINGVQTANLFTSAQQVKGGTAPTSVRVSHFRGLQKIFNLTCSHSAGLVYNIADTRGFKNGSKIILDDGTNREEVIVASFVVGVSFTITKAPTVVVPASVIKVDFPNFHSMRIVCGSTATLRVSAFEYEPLTISPSRALLRRNTEFRYEKISIFHKSVANGDDLYYPNHSDGVVGNWTTSNVDLVGWSSGTAAIEYTQDLKNIQVSSGVAYFKITSERLVPVLDETERF